MTTPIHQLQSVTANSSTKTIVIFGAALILLVLLSRLFDFQSNLVTLLLILVCLVGITLGYLQASEPKYPIRFYQDYMLYHHRFGSWQLRYDNIWRAGRPKVTAGLEEKTLDYVGLNLKNIDEFMAQLTPRLALKLITEQQHLLQIGIFHSENCASGACQAVDLSDEARFTTELGVEYTGVLAMFANRMVRLKKLLGYELYIPVVAVEGGADKFMSLFWQIKNAQ